MAQRDAFAAQVQAWAAKVKATERDIFREAFVDAAMSIIDFTPEESGAAKGNWTATKGDAVSWDRSNRETKARAKVTALAETLEIGDVASLLNSLPYIRQIEYGWTGGKGGYFPVFRSVQDWPKIVAEAVERAKAKHGLS